jgi:hypothetical protein
VADECKKIYFGSWAKSIEKLHNNFIGRLPKLIKALPSGDQ